jgi:hypothetical protein
VSGGGSSKLGWYARRLGRMSPAEIVWRGREQALRRSWARRQVRADQIASLPPLPTRERRFASLLPPDAASLVPAQARAALIADADRLLKGEWEMLGVVRTDMTQPDWFYCPVTGRRSAPDKYAFSVNQRSEASVGNIKQVWEVNRLQHLTLLAVAWYLTGTDAYAQRVAEQLRSWWRENPFLSGVNWTSGIELGVRLINFAWIRRLLDGWPGVADLFERNDLALRQIQWHQEYLAAFESRGSSANNHVIAEAAGQLAASCAFPWFADSDRWRRDSTRLLERELAHNTFPSGINRELASDYHGFVAELGFFAAIEAAAAGTPLGGDTWGLLCAMTDAMAALVDERGRPPRQGDSDEGRVVLLDVPEHNRWPALLALGDTLFGRLDWWPQTAPDACGALIGALLGERRAVSGRPQQRPYRYADAGLTILRTEAADSETTPEIRTAAETWTAAGVRTAPEIRTAAVTWTAAEVRTAREIRTAAVTWTAAEVRTAPEIWCRCDGGPHGFLSIAAHAHADALSVEVRYGGVDILADPGTYCYHGEPEWRSYFQSTVGHNTIELDGQWQSTRGGAFLWLRHATSRELEVGVDGPVASWTGEHDGYAVLSPAARHRRTVALDRESRDIEISDEIEGGSHDVKMAFHLGPEVLAELAEVAELGAFAAELSWPDGATPGAARLLLPVGLRWSLHRGETDPILGWYSAGLGERVPAFTLIGRGRSVPGTPLVTHLEFADLDRGARTAAMSQKAITLGKSGVGPEGAPEIPPEAR